MQNTIYARAKRGDLPPVLSIPDLCRLSTAGLDCPAGRYAPGDELARRLHQLVALGQIQPERSETVSIPGRHLASIGGSAVTTAGSTHLEHYVSAASVRAVLADLGDVGPLLLGWVDIGRDAAAPQTGEPWHRVRVRAFCEALLRAGDFDQDAPSFTAADVVQAMKQLGLWHRKDAGLPDDDSLRRYVADAEGAGKIFAFAPGRPTFDLPAELRVEGLIRAYQAGQKPDDETGSIRFALSNIQTACR